MEVEPIYIPGRFRTASRPSRTWISDALYSPLNAVPFSNKSSAIIRNFSFFEQIPVISIRLKPSFRTPQQRLTGELSNKTVVFFYSVWNPVSDRRSNV